MTSPADAEHGRRRPDRGVSWDNPERPNWASARWWRKALCCIGRHADVVDGYGWDGGKHCVWCGRNAPNDW